MELNVINDTKSKQDKSTVISNSNDKVADLKNIIKVALALKLPISRIGLFLLTDSQDKKVLLSNLNRPLRDYGITDKMTIVVKDLGPQIGWRLTYVIEYLGPLFFVIFFFLRLGPEKSNTTQRLGFMMASFHYAKRLYESIWVHDFSNSTMPLRNLLINCTYYWLIFGVGCGYSLFNENYQEPSFNIFIRYLFAFFFFSAEFKNLKCHLILQELKEKNRGEKGIPYGEGFEFVSCANYFWEFVAWLCFSIFVNLPFFYLFTLFGFLIMRNWAIKKHKDYLKNFPDRYPKDRKAFIPFLI